MIVIEIFFSLTKTRIFLYHQHMCEFFPLIAKETLKSHEHSFNIFINSSIKNFHSSCVISLKCLSFKKFKYFPCFIHLTISRQVRWMSYSITHQPHNVYKAWSEFALRKTLQQQTNEKTLTKISCRWKFYKLFFPST